MLCSAAAASGSDASCMEAVQLAKDIRKQREWPLESFISISGAALSGNLPLVRYLHEQFKMGFENDTLEKAAGSGNEALLEYLVAAGCQPCKFVPPLSLAVKNGDKATLEWLHLHGLLWQQGWSNGPCFFDPPVPVLRWLLEHGVSCCTAEGRYLLEMALSCAREDGVHLADVEHLEAWLERNPLQEERPHWGCDEEEEAVAWPDWRRLALREEERYLGLTPAWGGKGRWGISDEQEGSGDAMSEGGSSGEEV